MLLPSVLAALAANDETADDPTAGLDQAEVLPVAEAAVEAVDRAGTEVSYEAGRPRARSPRALGRARASAPHVSTDLDELGRDVRRVSDRLRGLNLSRAEAHAADVRRVLQALADAAAALETEPGTAPRCRLDR